jgi:hypothetical protein
MRTVAKLWCELPDIYGWGSFSHHERGRRTGLLLLTMLPLHLLLLGLLLLCKLNKEQPFPSVHLRNGKTDDEMVHVSRSLRLFILVFRHFCGLAFERSKSWITLKTISSWKCAFSFSLLGQSSF